MTAPINLNRARKARAKARAKQAAQENSVKYGRPKSERLAQNARKHRDIQALEGHRLDQET